MVRTFGCAAQPRPQCLEQQHLRQLMHWTALVDVDATHKRARGSKLETADLHRVAEARS